MSVWESLATGGKTVTELRRHCPDCNRQRDFDRVTEGNVATLEEWITVRCSSCGWIFERKRTKAPVIHVRPDNSNR